MEVFFRDNPSLISKTIFLSEGFPANQPISVKPLVEVAPNPSDEIVWEALDKLSIN